MPALAVCGVLALAGCGGDDGGEVTVSADELVPSKRDYIVQADTICANVQQGIETEAEAQFRISSQDFTVTPNGEIVFKPGRRPSDAQIERFGARTVVPAFREQVADLRVADPAATGTRRPWPRSTTLPSSGVDALQADPSLFTDSDAVRAELAEARRLGRAYGFFDCGTYSAP